jgi:hypothetical protein
VEACFISSEKERVVVLKKSKFTSVASKKVCSPWKLADASCLLLHFICSPPVAQILSLTLG